MKAEEYPIYLNMMNQWLILKHEGKCIDRYLGTQGYFNVAIYGMGMYGRHLVRELASGIVTINYGIDRKVMEEYKGIRIIQPIKELPPTDVIINTVICCKEQIVDLNAVMAGWTNEAEKDKIQACKRIDGRELQLEQLKILKWFRDFCERNKLTWWLGEGSLLGAVRHKGFIPWDDDIDIFMPYEDYLECIRSFPASEDYEILDWRVEDRYPFQFAKIVEKDTYQIHPIPFGYFTLGCAIDIFPLAGYPKDEALIKKKYKQNKRLDAKWDTNLILKNLYGDEISDERQNTTDTKYNIPFYKSDYVGTMQQIAGNAWATSREVFADTIYLMFEDDFFPVPKGYDTFLNARYGDYMTLPPVEKRRIHSYPTYKL